MKQKLILLIFTLTIGHAATGQEKSKFFHSMGIACISDYMEAPATVYTIYDGWGYNEHIDQYYGLSLMTYIYNCRFNMIEFSDDIALSASITPALGLFIPFNETAKGFGSVNFPLMFGLETGAGSTYRSSSGVGAFIRYGMEWTKAPVVITDVDEYAPVKLETFWIEPVVQVGMRFWNKQNKLQEISLKYGFGAAAPTGEYVEDNKLSRAKTIRVSWLMFLNY